LSQHSRYMRFRRSSALPFAAYIALVLAACTSTQPVVLSPDPVQPISPGDRLRVIHSSQCCTSPSIGVAEPTTGDSLIVRPDAAAQRFAIPRSTITQIDRWNTGQSHMLEGAGWGFLFGAAAGTFLGYIGGCSHCDGDMRPLTGAAGFVIGGGLGALAGMLAGTVRRGFWEKVY
jgi:hypothetical protein